MEALRHGAVEFIPIVVYASVIITAFFLSYVVMKVIELLVKSYTQFFQYVLTFFGLHILFLKFIKLYNSNFVESDVENLIKDVKRHKEKKNKKKK